MVERNIDSHNLGYHKPRLKEWIRKRDCYPIYVEIGPTNRCNHSCLFCALDWMEHGTHDIDKEVLSSALENMAGNGVQSVMFAGEGEPLLHKDTTQFIQTARKLGLATSVTTNGVPLTRKRAEQTISYLTWIRFSIDAGTSETYLVTHQPTNEEDFERVKRNIQDVVNVRNSESPQTNISAQFLMIPQNIAEVVGFTKMCRDIGVDNVQIKPYSQHPLSLNHLVVDYRDYKPIIPEVEALQTDRFKVFFRKNTIQRLEQIPYDLCHGLSFFALIDSKGNVIPCNMFYNNSDFTYGNLYQDSFSEIWQSKKRQQVLERLKQHGTTDCRQICRLDASNRFLDELYQLPESEAIKRIDEMPDVENPPEFTKFL